MKLPGHIISGGQTGADRAALDFAIEHGLPHSGWCPKGRRAEDGVIGMKYRLHETASAYYPVRTRLNVHAAEATVIFVPRNHRSPGSILTAKSARELGRPHITLDAFPDVGADASALLAFLMKHPVKILNVAGSRESSVPGLHAHVLAVFRTAYQQTASAAA